MKPEEKENNSGNKAAIVGTGIACSVVGAVLGAVGLYLWQKEENEQLQHAHSSTQKVYNKNEPCPICLDEMHELITLPCGHQYHVNCSNRLKSSESIPKCPICRKTISD